MERELLQKEKLETELRKEVTTASHKLLWYQERFKAKVELAKKAEQVELLFC